MDEQQMERGGRIVTGFVWVDITTIADTFKLALVLADKSGKDVDRITIYSGNVEAVTIKDFLCGLPQPVLRAMYDSYGEVGS